MDPVNNEPVVEEIELLDDKGLEEELLDLTPKKEEVKEEEVKEEEKEIKLEEEEKDELKEIEDDLKEPTDEDLELMTPVRRREILAKYPDLFKTFPYLEKAYYREQQFTELFPTIPEAKEALEKARTMEKFESQVMQDSNIGVVLDAVKAEGQENFNRVVDNFLPALHKADSGVYFKFLGNIIKSTIVSMVSEANRLGENGQPLGAAANILNQYVFGTNNFTKPEPLAKPVEENSKEEEISKREQEFITKQFESVRDDLQTRADNTLRATIEANIDPKKSMTDYVRKNANREAFEQLEVLIKQDTRFRSLIDKLWENAFTHKFDKVSQDRIRSAYLAKAKSLLPTVIKKARTEALRGLGKRTTEEESGPKKGPITVGRSTSSNSGKKPGEVPKGMKSIDFLMQD